LIKFNLRVASFFVFNQLQQNRPRSGISSSGETPQERSDEEAQRQPQGRIAYEKMAVGLFPILPAESEAL
jgi:hypothetical protein